MYGRKADDPAFSQYVEQVVRQHVGEIKSGVQTQVYVADGENENVAWEAWLPFYRRCLNLVIEDHGKPGDAFISRAGIIQDRIDSRPLGEQPEH